MPLRVLAAALIELTGVRRLDHLGRYLLLLAGTLGEHISRLELSLVLVARVACRLLGVDSVADAWQGAWLHVVAADCPRRVVLRSGRSHLLVHCVAHVRDRNTYFSALMLSSLQFLVELDAHVLVRLAASLHRQSLLHGAVLSRVLRRSVVLARHHLAAGVGIPKILRATTGTATAWVVVDEAW